MPVIPPPGWTSERHFFNYIRGLIRLAEDNSGEESALYVCINYVLTLFCSSALVTTTKSKKQRFLVCGPQKQVRASGVTEARGSHRIPDFANAIIPNTSGPSPTKGLEIYTSLQEVKTFTLPAGSATWSSFFMGYFAAQTFLPHIPQAIEQAVHSYRHDQSQYPTCVFLTMGIWFVYFEFGPFPDANLKTADDYRDAILGAGSIAAFCKVPPSSMFNAKWTSFNPVYIQKLIASSQRHEGYIVKPHPYFEAIAARPLIGKPVKLAHQLETFRRDIDLYFKALDYDTAVAHGEHDADLSPEPESIAARGAKPSSASSYKGTIPNEGGYATSPAKRRSSTIDAHLRNTNVTNVLRTVEELAADDEDL